ncbi:MAG TPA: glycoside hydrolase family 13 protein [Chitinophagaceae bacterium]|nr:glycoside hydrolase family 13 protein [Chitinophagaceae bacterium]
MKKLTFLIITIYVQLLCFAQINHVEPLNWWVGMKNPNLQLLVNGSNVGETMPVINYPGVTIKKVNKAGSKNYLFVDLLIAKDAKPGTFSINFKKDGETIYSYPYSLLTRERDALKIKGFNSSDVIYLITPDRFANGDYSNDIVSGMKETKIDRAFAGGRHGGDLRGIIDHLDYIKNMGFTAIWLTPVLENDMPSYSYHGYAITNHYKVDPRFGTLNDYKELSVKARQRGIKLIYDEVLNHTGSGYWWMNDLPFRDWLNYPDTKYPTNHRGTVNQDMYASHYDKQLMSKGWFDVSMPDMNGQNPFTENYLIQNSIWWIETLQLGGVREDTYGYSDKAFLKKWSCSIMNEYPNFSLVGEEWSLNPLITSYWQKGKKNHDGYTGCLTTVMDFPLQEALVQALKEPEGSDFGKGMTRIYEALANDFVYADTKNILVLGDNHDMDRIFMQLGQDVDLTKMALTYLLTIRGIPQIYYGTEVLLDNTPHHKNDGLIRADFPGGWKDDKVNGFTGEGLTADQLQVQSYLKKLLNWRKSNPVIASGETLHFAPFNSIYVYFRYDKEKVVMVVMNKNDKEMRVDANRFAEIIKGKKTAENVLTGEAISLADSFTVAPKTTTVFEIK